MLQPFRVVIIDDHKHAREAMKCIIDQDPLFEFVAEGSDGGDAVALTEQWMPDLILMDINMKEMDGLEATKEIKEQFPFVKIVMVTVSDDALHLFEAFKKGASGYLIKNLDPSSWLDYLKAIAFDEFPLSRELAWRMLKEFTAPQNRDDLAQITAREKDILTCLAKGASNKEIADQLCISEYTVKNHLKNILQKLHMENRVQLARYAIENKIINS